MTNFKFSLGKVFLMYLVLSGQTSFAHHPDPRVNAVIEKFNSAFVPTLESFSLGHIRWCNLYYTERSQLQVISKYKFYYNGSSVFMMSSDNNEVPLKPGQFHWESAQQHNSFHSKLFFKASSDRDLLAKGTHSNTGEQIFLHCPLKDVVPLNAVPEATQSISRFNKADPNFDLEALSSRNKWKCAAYPIYFDSPQYRSTLNIRQAEDNFYISEKKNFAKYGEMPLVATKDGWEGVLGDYFFLLRLEDRSRLIIELSTLQTFRSTIPSLASPARELKQIWICKKGSEIFRSKTKNNNGYFQLN